MISMSAATSASSRLVRFSAEQMKTVTCRMPAAWHQASAAQMCCAPCRCPSLGLDRPAAFAQRRFPSMISPMCCGSGAPRSLRRSRLSYKR